MHHLKVENLYGILKESGLHMEFNHQLEVNPNYLKGKGENFLNEVFSGLGGSGTVPILEKLKFDFKVNRHVFLYDDEVHFNRYRLTSLKTSMYEVFSFPWTEAYLRLCRTYEKECLKTGLQERIWNGPPIAGKLFGKSEIAGELSANGSSGWKLNAYNDTQYDLVSRLHGYKLIRIPLYENLMIGGSLKKIDDLLLHPKEENRQGILNWFSRKIY
ncbi:hypothetical protein MMU07_14540 [Aquiflexum sp. LQ15W]|uniref:DUF7255 family protein n=1 Tax=Cognataquiflexum nitidum TaxID=2922272 RepID=UPI001F1412CE|nr:hypothetical protein [Cognataquiflexum nitidum]MCH6200800.1 hypothetical protein [Cognataquiflexum nitidum]